MRLKLDENLGHSAKDCLVDAGFDVETVPQQGLCSATDRDLLSVCVSESRCLVTLDLDFSNPITFPPAEHAGIAVLRLAGRNPTHELHAALETLASELRKTSPKGRLWVIKGRRLREYQPE